MKIQNLFFSFLVAFLIFPISVFANEINLYDQPKADAKVVTTVDPAAGIIPIFTPKEGGWVKVADPRNGNVGWMKSSDFNSAGASQSTFTFTQSIVNDNKAPTTYRIIQFGQPRNLTPEQSQSIIKQMEIQQKAAQQSMQDMLHNMNQLFMDRHFPMIMPVVVLPVEKSAPAGNKQPPKTSTPTK